MTGRGLGADRGTLQRLDDVVLLPAARRLQAGVRRGRLWAAESLPTQEALRTDPVRALRQRPQALVGAVIVLVLLTSVVAVLTHRDRQDTGATAGPTAAVTTVGPAAGQQVRAYAAQADGRLARFARAHPGTLTYAVVDFKHYLSSAQVARLVGPAGLVRAYLHVTVRGAQTPLHVLSVNSAAELPAAVARLGKVAAQESQGFQQLLQIVATPTSERERAVRSAYSDRLRTTQAEAKALTPTCSCIYAVVLKATGATLQQMGKAGLVRIVDPAPADAALADLATIPVLPEVTGAVPENQGFR